MKKLLILFLVLCLGQVMEAQITQVFKRYAVQSAVGQSIPFQFALGQTTPSSQYTVSGGFVPSRYTITVTPTGAPGTCTYRVKGSLKMTNENPVAADFVNGELTADIDCTVKRTIHVVGKPWISILGEVVTLTGGTSPTVQLEILAMP